MKRSQVFEVLEPPPFGLERLRARRDEQPRRLGTLVLVGLATCACLVLLRWPRPSAVDLVSLARATSAAPMMGHAVLSEVTALDNTGVLALPSTDPQVSLYRVASLEPLEQPSAMTR